ncbi:hypothetical protein SAMN05216436_108113 [bacterium A37T11]|nr:hypothetical protein SAMN05216436_108113 [bacterium A37T11]
MDSHLPYYSVLNTMVQQQMAMTSVLKTIDIRLGQHQHDQFNQLMVHLQHMDHRLQVFIDCMITKSLPYKEWLDNNDLMAMFSIQKSKLYELKRSGFFRVYDLDGKEMCRHEEVTQAVLDHPKIFLSENRKAH